MPASRTPLPLHPLVLFGVALLGGTLVWQPGLAARGGQQPPSAERQRVERLSQRAMDRVRALQTEADELASRERTLLGEIRRLEIDRQIRTEELGVIDGDLAETTGQLEDTATRISDLEREADAQRPLVEARLVALYKMGTPRYTRLLLGAGDLRALGRNYRLIGSLARRDREQFDDLRETVTDLRVSRSTLEARQVEVAALQEAARAARRALDRTIASQTALVEEIDTRRDLTAQLAGELEATPGESVYAIHEGEVVSVGTFEGLGTLVIVSHGDQAFSLYGYLASLAVHEGGQVDERAELGTAGVSPTGDATVYFELRIDGRPVDPVEWLKQ